MSLSHPADGTDPASPSLDPAWGTSPVSAWISTLARWLLGGVLIASGAIKVVDLADSATAVQAYQLVPEPLGILIGSVIPFVAILLGLVLLAGAVTRVTAIVTALLLIVFLVVIATAAARGLSVDCGCFGGGGEVAAGQARYGLETAGGIGLLLLSGWLIARPRSRFSFDRAPAEDELIKDEDREASLI